MVDNPFQMASRRAEQARFDGGVSFMRGEAMDTNPFRQTEEYYLHNIWRIGWLESSAVVNLSGSLPDFVQPGSENVVRVESIRSTHLVACQTA